MRPEEASHRHLTLFLITPLLIPAERWSKNLQGVRSLCQSWPHIGHDSTDMSGSVVLAFGEVLPIICIGTTRSCWAGIPPYPAALSGSTGLEPLPWLLQGPQTSFPHVLLGMPQATRKDKSFRLLEQAPVLGYPPWPTLTCPSLRSSVPLPRHRTLPRGCGDDTGTMRVCFYSDYPGSDRA